MPLKLSRHWPLGWIEQPQTRRPFKHWAFLRDCCQPATQEVPSTWTAMACKATNFDRTLPTAPSFPGACWMEFWIGFRVGSTHPRQPPSHPTSLQSSQGPPPDHPTSLQEQPGQGPPHGRRTTSVGRLPLALVGPWMSATCLCWLTVASSAAPRSDRNMAGAPRWTGWVSLGWCTV